MKDALSQLDMPDDLRAALREALARLVELAKPEVVILFGSWAEGRARPDSDVDLVVVARTRNTWHLAGQLYLLWYEVMDERSLIVPVDFLVYTPRQFEKENLVGFVPYQALLHGKVIYGEPPATTQRLAS